MDFATVLEYTAGYGIFATLFVASFWYMLKENSKREDRLITENKNREAGIREDYARRESRLYEIIERYADKLDAISTSLSHINNSLEGIEKRINGK